MPARVSRENVLIIAQMLNLNNRFWPIWLKPKFSTTISPISADVLVNNRKLNRFIKPQSHLILSGILANEVAEVENFEEELKLKFKSVKTELEKQ